MNGDTLAIVALIVSAIGPVTAGLVRFTVSQVELRLATVEIENRRLRDEQTSASSLLAVLRSQRDGDSAAIRRIESKVDRLSVDRRSIAHHEQGDPE